MNKPYFTTGEFYDGQVVGMRNGTQRMELRAVGDLISVAVLTDLGWELLSKEYIQDDLADAEPTIVLINFTVQSVAQLATELELNAIGLEGGWNMADQAPNYQGPALAPFPDTTRTVYQVPASNTFFGYIGTDDRSAVTTISLLGGAAAALAEIQKRKQQSVGFGERFLNAIGL